MSKLSHRERIQTIIAGEKPDRFAASMWRHFFHLEDHAEGTAEAMLMFQKEFDWDFLKINPRTDFYVEDFGFKHRFSHDEFKKPTKLHFPIKTANDWLTLKNVETTAPALSEHLKMISLIKRGSDSELPILMTQFSPLSIAGRMVPDRQMLIDHIRSEPDKVEIGLRTITDTYKQFTSEIRNAGADGLFFATLQWASEDMLTFEEYERFGVPYDLELIQAAESDALNLLHVCHTSAYIRELSRLDYNSVLYNWDSQHPTNLSIEQALEQMPGKTLVGGIDQEGWLRMGTPDEISRMIIKIKSDYDDSKLILGPGCAIPPEVPNDNLRALRDSL